jgi:hypothetical protein
MRCREGEIGSNMLDQDTALLFEDGTPFEGMLRRIPVRAILVAGLRRLAPDPVQVLTEAAMPGEHLRPVRKNRGTNPTGRTFLRMRV